MTVTIPEGYTVAQISQVLKQAEFKVPRIFEQEATSYGPLPYMYRCRNRRNKGEGFYLQILMISRKSIRRNNYVI